MRSVVGSTCARATRRVAKFQFGAFAASAAAAALLRLEQRTTPSSDDDDDDVHCFDIVKINIQSLQRA